MKLIDLTCPHCGGHLKIDNSKKECYCPYCGAKLLIDDETIHVKYDNAETAGYQFEKGRQRAQKEAAANESKKSAFQSNAASSGSPNKDNKHNSIGKIILLILAWIYFFPITLTVFIIRNKKLSTKTKAIIIAVVWISICVATGIINYHTATTTPTPTIAEQQENSSVTSTDENTEEEISESTVASATASTITAISEDTIAATTATTDIVTAASTEEVEKQGSTEQVEEVTTNEESTEVATTSDEITYCDNELINQFVTEYNSKYESDISGLTPSGPGSSYQNQQEGSVGNLSITIYGTPDGEGLYIELYGADEGDNVSSEMYSTVKKLITTLDSSLSEKDIDAEIQKIQKDTGSGTSLTDYTELGTVWIDLLRDRTPGTSEFMLDSLNYQLHEN